MSMMNVEQLFIILNEKIIFYFEKNVLIFLIITINICLNKPIDLIGIKISDSDGPRKGRYRQVPFQ
jgi:hypothetical protein